MNLTNEQINLLKICVKENDFTFNGYKTLAKCVEIYDGDTIRIKFFYNNILIQKKIRLYGFDSPELKPSKKNRSIESINDEKKSAIVARDKLKELIGDDLITVEFLKDDKYGRPLTKIYKDDKELNKIMIETNNGYVYNGGKKS